MFARLPDALLTNQMLAWQAKFTNITVAVEIVGSSSWTIRIADGTITATEGQVEAADLRLRATETAWQKYLEPVPPVGFQTIGAMFTSHNLSIENYLIFARYMFQLEGLFSSLRPGRNVDPPEILEEASIEPVVGRYLRVNIEGRPHRIYFEEAGQGIPLLCLHTAGADGRQYRAILNDAEIISRFRVIVFDLPWHGKSSPPPGFQNELYTLSTDRYVETIMAFKRALTLDRPVVMGCSIGGRAVLHLAIRHGQEFRAAVGLQSALHAEYRETDSGEGRLYRPDINSAELGAANVAGLMGPDLKAADRWETLWHYMQGAAGVFMGDLFYYLVDGDLRNGSARGIDTTKCPLYLLSGEYDLSATPEMGAHLAREVNATSFEVMKGLGHFPMSESPENFRQYILPILDKIRMANESSAQ